MLRLLVVLGFSSRRRLRVAGRNQLRRLRTVTYLTSAPKLPSRKTPESPLFMPLNCPHRPAPAALDRAVRGSSLAIALVFLLALRCAFPALACNVPVFRYALERWQAEPYEAVIFHRGPLSPADRAAVVALEKARDDAHANLNVTLADLDFPLGRLPAKLWKNRTNAPLPHLVVSYQGGATEGLVAWAGPLGENAARTLADSPVRRALAKELLAGKSAVWLLLESGNATADAAAAALLEKELRVQEKELELPRAATDDPKMRAKLPLRIAFSVLRLPRTDPAEAPFITQLLAGESQTNQPPVPVAFPVFGRGRALAALSGGDLSTDVIESASRFLTGACSCEVKELNPGKDLLLAADWDSIFEEALPPEERTPLANPAIPPGLGPETNTVIGASPAATDAAAAANRNFLHVVLSSLVALGLFSAAVTLWRKS